MSDPAQPDYRQTLHTSVAEVARAVLAGTLGPVEAARKLLGLAAELDSLEDEDFRFFVELDSESDTFPLGEVRERWNPTALEREDRSRREFESTVRSKTEAHCRNLIARYASSP